MTPRRTSARHASDQALRGVLAPLLSYEDALQAGLLADEGLLPNDDHDSNNEGYEGGAKEQATGAAKRLADAEVDEEAKSPRASQATELVRLGGSLPVRSDRRRSRIR